MTNESNSNRDESLPRKERERLMRRSEILAAAFNVFGEKGFDRATLDEIAERAEFGKGTLYNYFSSKEDLFAAAFQRLLDDFRAIAEGVCGQDLTVRACLTEYTMRSVAYYREHYAFCHTAMQEHYRRSVEGGTDTRKAHQENVDYTIEPLARCLDLGMKSGEVREADPWTYAHIFVGLIDHFYLQLTREQLPDSEDEMRQQVDTLITVFCDGIAVGETNG